MASLASAMLLRGAAAVFSHILYTYVDFAIPFSGFGWSFRNVQWTYNGRLYYVSFIEFMGIKPVSPP